MKGGDHFPSEKQSELYGNVFLSKLPDFRQNSGQSGGIFTVFSDNVINSLLRLILPVLKVFSLSAEAKGI